MSRRRLRNPSILALMLGALLLAVLAPPPLSAAPQGQLSDDVIVVIEEPRPNQTVTGEVTVRGYALDRRGAGDAGVRATPGGVQVWLDRGAGSATGRLLGDAEYGETRPDIAAQFGPAYARSGFALRWNSCLVPEGRHSLQVFVESTSGSGIEFGIGQVDLAVGACAAGPATSGVAGAQPLRTQPAWEAILRRTSELRGLAPREELHRALLTRESYDQRWGADLQRYYQSPAVDTSRLLLTAFGLLDPGVNLADELRRLQSTLPIGVYDADNRVLFVSRDPPDSPLGRLTMAHEITHALQDQHYGLQALLSRGQSENRRNLNPEEDLAIRALLEGDALIVQRMYQATTIQDAADLARLATEEAEATAAAADAQRLPYALYMSTYFPYLYGPSFIFGVLGERPLTTYGQYGPAVDALFRRPPVSTSQILHPERYRDGVAPVLVELRNIAPLLGSEWTMQGEGPQGELNHLVILDNWLRGTQPERAAQVAAGWTGDNAIVYRRLSPTGVMQDDVVVVLRTRWESPAAAGVWAQAYADTIPLRYGDPVRYSGRTDQLISATPGPGQLTWEMPGERGIALVWRGQFSTIAIAPTAAQALELANHVNAAQ